MAKRRMINKDDVESVLFGDLSIRQRYLFMVLQLYADDDGIIPAALVSSRVFPYDFLPQNEVDSDLKKLQEIKLLLLYNNNNYVQVCNWSVRQKLRKDRYTPTKHPHPPGYKPLHEIDNQSVTKGMPSIGEESLVEPSGDKPKPSRYKSSDDIPFPF